MAAIPLEQKQTMLGYATEMGLFSTSLFLSAFVIRKLEDLQISITVAKFYSRDGGGTDTFGKRKCR